METVQERDTAATSQTVAAAMRDRDFETLGKALADDVVLHSPITGSFRFEGRDEVLTLLPIVRDALEDLQPEVEFGDDDTRALMFSARIGRQEIQGIDLLRFDDEGRVREFRIFIRPLPGVAALSAALAPAVAARGGIPRALISPPTRLLAFFARVSDRVAIRILRRSFSRGG